MSKINLTNSPFTYDEFPPTYRFNAYFCKMKRIPLNHPKLIIVLFWLLIFFTFWIQFLRLASVLEVTLLILSIMSIYIPTNHYLSNHLLKKAIYRKKLFPFLYQYLTASLFMTIVIAVIFFCFRHMENIGLFAPSRLFFHDDTILNDIASVLPGTFIINLAFCGLRFYYEHAQLVTINHQLQFKTLQEQITPHFMFNVLNHIHILMQEDVEKASSLLVKYSDILRYQLYQGEKKFISLEQEVQFLVNYIDVEQVRWEDKLNVACTWSVTNGKAQIPPLLLITFVENAFKHVFGTNTAKGFVNISLEQKENELSLTIENSSTPQPEKEDSGIGLENVRRRLDILFPERHTLDYHVTNTTYSTLLTLKL